MGRKGRAPGQIIAMRRERLKLPLCPADVAPPMVLRPTVNVLAP